MKVRPLCLLGLVLMGWFYYEYSTMFWGNKAMKSCYLVFLLCLCGYASGLGECDDRRFQTF